MRKLKRSFLFLIVFAALLVASCGFPCGAYALQTEVYLGGMPAGFTLGMGGAQVVGICEVLTEEGVLCPARDAGIEVGDIICSIGGMDIENAADIDKAISGGKSSACIYRRGEEELCGTIQPAKDMASGRMRLGVLVRDSVSGIGTVTYIQKDDLRFGSLGHAVSDEKGKLLSAENGNIYRCSIVNVVRGERGRAGELKGLFLNDSCVAVADKNCETGIYGNFRKGTDCSQFKSVSIGENAKPGNARIVTTTDGVTPSEYDICIVKVDEGNRQNKNFVIKITDEGLLDATGGIVQGMSGSPILQDGKLIGAVTHVFLNDPTRGYGISITNMLGK